MSVFGTGYIPDKPDARDTPFTAGFGKRADASAQSMRGLTPVQWQGPTSRCVAFCTSDALLIREAVVGVKPVVQPSINAIYFNARRIDGLHKEDGGSVIRTAIKSLRLLGVPSEQDHPTMSTPSAIADAPSFEAMNDGHQRKGGDYVRLFTAEDMVAAISNRLPFICGITIDENFDRLSGAASVWRPGGSKRGGHCLTFVDYDAAKGQFVGKNSWGIGWGEGGYFYVPRDVLSAQARDTWAIDGWQRIRRAA